jgi:hypothetical protein
MGDARFPKPEVPWFHTLYGLWREPRRGDWSVSIDGNREARTAADGSPRCGTTAPAPPPAGRGGVPAVKGCRCPADCHRATTVRTSTLAITAPFWNFVVYPPSARHDPCRSCAGAAPRPTDPRRRTAHRRPSRPDGVCRRPAVRRGQRCSPRARRRPVGDARDLAAIALVLVDELAVSRALIDDLEARLAGCELIARKARCS